MKVSYLVEIEDPHLHLVKVTLTGKRAAAASTLDVFLPSWSPGSYLMREYARHVRWLRATQDNGEVLWVEQTAKGTWRLDWDRSQLKKRGEGFSVTYLIYLHELTVRTSHVDNTHAFLHGPSYLLGVLGEALTAPTIEFRFPPLWSHVSTSLKEVTGGARDKFVYTAANYDELVDCPVEIGCHVIDGFLAGDVPHALAFYGEQYPHGNDLKKDFKTIVETVSATMGGGYPFDHYQFITHLVPKLYGGLEHSNSTALHFDGRRLGVRKDYLTFLSLVAHEYFHAWNIKRIRPKELGPFDYRNEAYTTLLWLAEGLTSFMDDLFVYRAGLSTLEEYLDFVRGHLDGFFSTPGRRFHSLEDSSYNAWIKLYRPDENLRNSSVSYYLKGGLVFMALHADLRAKGKGIDDLLAALWEDYKARPASGVTKEIVYGMVEKIGGAEVLGRFQTMVETTQDIDFSAVLGKLGLELVWQEGPPSWLGVEWDFFGDRAIVRTVLMDSPGAKSGLNAGDEIIALNGLRVLKEDVEKWGQVLRPEQPYELWLIRLGKLTRLELTLGKSPLAVKEIRVVDRQLAVQALGVPNS